MYGCKLRNTEGIDVMHSKMFKIFSLGLVYWYRCMLSPLLDYFRWDRRIAWNFDRNPPDLDQVLRLSCIWKIVKCLDYQTLVFLVRSILWGMNWNLKNYRFMRIVIDKMYLLSCADTKLLYGANLAGLEYIKQTSFSLQFSFPIVSPNCWNTASRRDKSGL